MNATPYPTRAKNRNAHDWRVVSTWGAHIKRHYRGRCTQDDRGIVCAGGAYFQRHATSRCPEDHRGYIAVRGIYPPPLRTNPLVVTFGKSSPGSRPGATRNADSGRRLNAKPGRLRTSSTGHWPLPKENLRKKTQGKQNWRE